MTSPLVITIATLIGANLSHLGLEILIFVAVEILSRLVFVRGNAGQRIHNKLLITQGIVLLTIISFLAKFHHTPYVLLLILIAIIGRLVQKNAFPAARMENGAISRPLLFTSDSLEDTEPFHMPVERYPPEYVKQHLHQQQQPFILSRPHQREHTPPPVPGGVDDGFYRDHKKVQLTQHHTQYPPFPPAVGKMDHVKPVTSQGVSSSTTVTPRNLAKRVFSPNEKVASSQLSSLQRSPIASSCRPPSLTQSLKASRLRDSLFSYHGPPTSYFSSLFHPHVPSTTPPGLLNAGNTCFVNSVLQCLTWTPGFIEITPTVVAGSDSANTLLHKLGAALRKCHILPDGETYFDSVDVTELLDSLSQSASHLVVARGSGEYQSQQDAAEFLLWLLDSLHDAFRQQTPSNILSQEEMSDLSSKCQLHIRKLEAANSNDIPSFREPLTELSELDWALNGSRNSSVICDLFMGQLVEARECQKCTKMSVNVEYFTVLPLPLPVAGKEFSYNLAHCFQLFREVEDLVEANMLLCSCTAVQAQDGGFNLTPGKRLALLSKPPSRLVIQLTRFSYDRSVKTVLKNSVPVAFPTAFDLYPHTMGTTLGINGKSMLYQLYAFCTHSGAQSTSYGHYMAYCKAANGQWYCFNDAFVSYIADVQQTLDSPFVLQNAYLLFYKAQSVHV